MRAYHRASELSSSRPPSHRDMGPGVRIPVTEGTTLCQQAGLPFPGPQTASQPKRPKPHICNPRTRRRSGAPPSGSTLGASRSGGPTAAPSLRTHRRRRCRRAMTRTTCVRVSERAAVECVQATCVGCLRFDSRAWPVAICGAGHGPNPLPRWLSPTRAPRSPLTAPQNGPSSEVRGAKRRCVMHCRNRDPALRPRP